MPESYVFVPKGDIYITRHCRAKAKKARQVVYAVYVSPASFCICVSKSINVLTALQDNAGKRVQGIRVPADVYAEVSKLAVLTAKERASAVEARDTKFVARGRELLRSQFPHMPDKSLELIIEHSFLKGSGRVGRTSTTTDEHKAILAVEAHIRHKHTPYESLLAAGMDRKNARKIVWPAVQAIRDTWAGGDKQSLECLPMRLWPSGIEK